MIIFWYNDFEERRVAVEDKKWLVQKEMSLLDFLIQYSGLNKKTIKQSISAGKVAVDGKYIRQANSLVSIGSEIKLEKIVPKTHLPFDILYEDDELIAINKPSGLLSVKAGLENEKTAYRMVGEYLKKQRSTHKVFVVHRLDKDTSGVLLFAKNYQIQQELQNNWNSLVKIRGYLALVEGWFAQTEGTLKNYLSENKGQIVYVSNSKSGKLAITHYRVLEKKGPNSLLEIFLDTGRKNQIRVQMAHIHHPLVGDKKYNPHPEKSRLCLHAHMLVFQHPKTHQEIRINAPIPDFLLKSGQEKQYK